MTDYGNRSRVLHILDTHPAHDNEERSDVEFIRSFVLANENCFGKVNPTGHITGSAFIVDPAGRILMTFHRKLQRWLQLGGHGTVDETDPSQTALREAVEEAGSKTFNSILVIQTHPLTSICI